MPQASDELRERWGGPDDRKAINHLGNRGYVLTVGFEWYVPPWLKPTEEDLSAVEFLIQEWDWGGLTHKRGRRVDD
jgi:hypothetical protein